MKTKQRNIMIDIETWSTKPNAAIRSTSAVEFDINTGDVGKVFYVNISSHKDIDFFDYEKSTIAWWKKQSPQSQYIFHNNQINIDYALNQLNHFLRKNDIIWAKSPAFDCVILKTAMEYFKINPKWKFYNERCVRTIVALDPLIKNISFTFSGIKHYAVDDCINQIKQVCYKSDPEYKKKMLVDQKEKEDKFYSAGYRVGYGDGCKASYRRNKVICGYQPISNSCKGKGPQ